MSLTEEITTIRDVEFAVIDGRRLLLDLYLPSGEPALRPLIVWVHGGAWLMGNKTETPAIPLVAAGYAVASISYRFSAVAQFPAQLHDCKAAIRWLRAHADQYGLDTDRIGAWGLSAGGHLAALLGTTGDVAGLEGQVGSHFDFSSRVHAVCDWYGPVDLSQMNDHLTQSDHDGPGSPESLLIGGPVQENPDKIAVANPITYIGQDIPPFLIMHGDRDTIVPLHQSELLHAALREAGRDTTFNVIEGAGHGFDHYDVLKDVEDFFDSRLRNRRA